MRKTITVCLLFSMLSAPILLFAQDNKTNKVKTEKKEKIKTTTKKCKKDPLSNTTQCN